MSAVPATLIVQLEVDGADTHTLLPDGTTVDAASDCRLHASGAVVRVALKLIVARTPVVVAVPVVQVRYPAMLKPDIVVHVGLLPAAAPAAMVGPGGESRATPD